MLHLKTRAASALTALLTAVIFAACNGGTTSRFTPVGGNESPADLQSASIVQPTVLWYSYCDVCGVLGARPTEYVDATATATGAVMRQFSFGQGGAPAFLITSQNQQHVYATILRGGENAIADIYPQTFATRYYAIPILFKNGSFNGLLVSPDGTRLYAPMYQNTGGSIYVINTISRTIAAVDPVSLSMPALSPDGKTLFGKTAHGLTAIDTTRLGSGRVFASIPAQVLMTSTAASAKRLYVATATPSRIRMYDTASLAFLGTIAMPSFPQGMTLDAAASRLFVWINGASSSETVVINTSTNTLVKTLPGVLPLAVDPLTHVLYGAFNSEQCSYTPPTFARTCLTQARSPFGIQRAVLGSVTTTN